MRRRVVLLATASLAYSSQNVFSVHDDLLAFPQYEVIFSETYISNTEAESRLAYASSSSSANAKATSTPLENEHPSQEPTAELSTRSHGAGGTLENSDAEFVSTPEYYESMILNSTPYLCSIPRVDPLGNSTSFSTSKAEEEKELTRAADRGWELLKDMERDCMYFVSGWWSYSFCHNTHVKQFHMLPPGRGGVPIYPPIEDPTTPSYVLGKYRGPRGKSSPSSIDSPESASDTADTSADNSPPPNSGGLEVTSMQAKGDMRYLVQKLGGGTTCDLTGKDRRVEVQFHCHPQSTDRIGWIKEVSTCSYLMVIYTPRLCNDVAFLPPRENKPHAITCREIVPESEVGEWKTRKAAEAERLLVNSGSSGEEDNNNQNNRPMFVGGIEVGAMKQVGKEGRRIEFSAAAPPAPPPGQKVDVVAQVNPKEKGGKVQKLSNEELRKRELDPATVEMIRKEVEQMAGDKPWKLELVDVQDGVRELRGFVDAGDEEGEEGNRGEVVGSRDEEEEEEEEDREVDQQDNEEESYKDEL